MTLQTRRLTYEEYLSLPETKVRYEIVDGVMVMSPSPTVEHQRILRKIFLALPPICRRKRSWRSVLRSPRYSGAARATADTAAGTCSS